MIHPTALIDPAAVIGENVFIGPYCVIEAGVEIGAGSWLQGHVTVCGPTKIGTGNKFYAYGSIGQQSQDLKYKGEPTYLEIGDNNCFREFVPLHRGTDHVIFSNNGTLGGHVEVGDHAIIGGLTAVHQFCRIGRFALTGGCSKIVQDVPPFMIADGNPALVRGINQVGMERNGFAPETIRALREAYRVIYRSQLNAKQGVDKIRETLNHTAEINHLLEFIESSQRGIIRRPVQRHNRSEESAD